MLADGLGFGEFGFALFFILFVAGVVGAEGGAGFVFAGEIAAGQGRAGEDAEILLDAEGEDFFFGGAVEAVIGGLDDLDAALF